jgi:hypothetical protein
MELNSVAGDKVPAAFVLQRWMVALPATIIRDGAPVVEPATPRRINGLRNAASDLDRLTRNRGIRDRHRRDEGLSIGM